MVGNLPITSYTGTHPPMYPSPTVSHPPISGPMLAILHSHLMLAWFRSIPWLPNTTVVPVPVPFPQHPHLASCTCARPPVDANASHETMTIPWAIPRCSYFTSEAYACSSPLDLPDSSFVTFHFFFARGYHFVAQLSPITGHTHTVKRNSPSLRQFVSGFFLKPPHVSRKLPSPSQRKQQ